MTATDGDVPPLPPGNAGPSGRRLWSDVLGKYELEEHETALLREMVRTVDLLDELAAIVEVEGLMVVDPGGKQRTHPAVVEARQLRIAFARLSASLRLPSGDESEQAGKSAHLRRPQRRGAARGTYGIRGSVA
ncbi:hypothetical protein [Actinoplanes subtropicus]|uniref:hypothetical protein n=1 Tax=Actinoplanes subtropicus TaxID=543632 RepID=UPI00068DB425|nr:hypothetical protein [Actinoplanes subtropicus]